MTDGKYALFVSGHEKLITVDLEADITYSLQSIHFITVTSSQRYGILKQKQNKF